MRQGVIAAAILMAGCTISPEGAPVWYKTPEKTDVKYDGVDLTLICEMSRRLGTEYLAEGVTRKAARAMPDMWGQLEMLSLENISCGRPQDLLDLPFVSDPQRRLVSTWSELPGERETEAWASCLADTTRAPGDRVVLCEVTPAVSVPIAREDITADLPPAETEPEAAAKPEAVTD